MSNTTEIITELVPHCPGWHRNAGPKNLLSVVGRAVNAYYSEVLWKFADGSNKGLSPYLITQDEVYQYVVSSANLSCGDIEKTINGTSYLLLPDKVQKVYVDSSQVLSSEYGIRRINPGSFTIGGKTFVEIPVNSEPGSRDTPPIVRFTSNPGAYDDRYLIDVGVKPPELTSEAIPIPVPDQFIEGIIDYVQGYCQKRESGRESELLVLFEQKHKPAFKLWFEGVATQRAEANRRLC